MTEDIGELTGVQFEILYSKEASKNLHKNMKILIETDDERYNLKIKSKYTKNNITRIKATRNLE